MEIMIPIDRGLFKPNISKLVALSVLLLLLPYPHTGGVSTSPSQSPNVPLTPPALPVLRQGDIWHYHLRLEGNSTQSIRRKVTCGDSQCVVSSEVNAAYNDTRWIVPGNWSLVREYCVGCDGLNVTTNTVYTPAQQLFAFPLQPGESWWWNGTASGWTLDANGVMTSFSYPVSIVRKVINETSITVPAGTFDTFLVAELDGNGTALDRYSWFSLEAGTSVKDISLDSAGGVIDSRELVSYRMVGIYPGEFILLGDISVVYRSNDTSPQLADSSLRDVDSIEVTIQNVTGTNVTFGISWSFKNGTRSSTTNMTDLSTGSPPTLSIGPLIVEAGLRSGNSIPNWHGMSLNNTRNISYLGTFREVGILNLTQMLQPPQSGSIRLLRYWDRASGFLLATRTDIDETYSRNGTSYFLTESISTRIVSTNLWQGYIPSLKVGDWVKYGDFSGSWTSNVPGDQNTVQSYQDTYWQIDNISEVSGSNVSLGTTVAFNNGTGSREYGLSGNVSAGAGNLTSLCTVPCILAANLRAGDQVFDPVYSPTAPAINQTVDRIYLGTHRRVNVLNITSTIPMPYNGSNRNVGIYDQATGVLLEFFYTSSLSYQNYTRTASAHYRITETNLWNTTRPPDFSLSVLHAMLSLQPGASGTSEVILTSVHGFADSVNLAVEVSPTGPSLGPVPDRLIVTANPAHLTSSFLLNVSARLDLPAGIFNVTLTGSNGLMTHTTILFVLVYRPVPVECGTKNTCFLLANVTISNVKSAGNTIHFTADGPHGIMGYANVTIPSTSLPDPNSLEVIVDKARLPQSAVEIRLDSTGHGYLVHFTFRIHGPVNVDLLLGRSQPQPGSPQPFIRLTPTSAGIIGVSVAIVASLGVEAYKNVRARRRDKNSPERSGGTDRSPRWASILTEECRRICRSTGVAISA